MSSMAVDGLISGLNTTDMISSLMQLEAAPQTLLRTKSSKASTLVSALQSLNTKVASLATAATKAADAASWDAYKVTSSASNVIATASASAKASSLTFRVDSVAAGQVTMVDWQNVIDPTTLSVERDGTTHAFTPAGTTVHDLVAAINADTSLGISAVAVRTGTGANDFRLQLSGPTGALNTFEVTVDGGVPLTPVVVAADAKITLWPDAATGAGTVVTSATNTFENLLDGVNVTVTEPTKAGDPAVTLSVSQDTAATKNLAAGLVNNISTVLSEIESRTRSTTSTSADGREVVAGGVLSGNSTVRFLGDQLRSAATMSVDGRSPAEVGITLDRSGKVSFDEAKFNAAMAKDPAGTQAIVSAISARIGEIATSASDPTEGTLTLQITAQEGVVKDLNRQVEDWDRRLETRRAGLERTYSQLEVMLGQLQSQSEWLAGQLSGLPSWNSSK